MIEIDGQKYVCRIITYHFADKSFLFRYNKKQGVGILFVQNENLSWDKVSELRTQREVLAMLNFMKGELQKKDKKKKC